MKLKLLLLLLVFLCTFIIPAQLSKHDHHPIHGNKDHREKHGERHADKHGKQHSRVEDLMLDYNDDNSDDDDDEERGEWLFQLQDIRGNCSLNPCLNNGVCVEKKGRFKCRCPRPFKGRKCEKSKKACRRDTCGYGQCVLTSSPPYFECKCIPPFKPPNCKNIAPCELNPCQNGGTCEKDGQDFNCICKTGYSGKFCQVDSNDCYKGNGESYRGMVSETDDGHDCLYWNSYLLLGKGPNPFNTLSDPQGLGPHNFCRNPDGESKPWCFVRSGKEIRWEYCDVRKCSTATTTAPPGIFPTTNYPVIRPTALGTSRYVIPGTPTPESSNTRIPTTGRGNTGIPIPGIANTGTPTTGRGNTGNPIPGIGNTGKPKPISPTNGSPFIVSAGSNAAGSNTPGSGFSGGHPTGSSISGSHSPEILGPEAQGIPTTMFATCGKPQPKRPINRIYGGIKALPGGQPWQASVQVKAKGTIQPFSHICGGTLIKPCWVLTAGHCIDDKKDYQVVLGGTNLGKTEETQQKLEVVETIIHEQYRETSESVYNDIGLLRLKDKNGQCAKESQFVKIACLPRKDFPDGTECSISGWGATESSQYGSTQLLNADVLLISQEVCSSTNVYGKFIDKTMFCAGYLEGGVDSCQGDSGGPLICEENQTHFIYGIVSWGDNCGLKNKPGVYTRVTHFVDWINRKTTHSSVKMQ